MVAAKKKLKRVAAKGGAAEAKEPVVVPKGKKLKKGPGGLIQLRADAMKGVREAIELIGKKKSTEKSYNAAEEMQLLEFSNDAVPGHVVGVISSGSVAIDRATGVNGLPRGRLVEILGQESNGKTTLVLSTVAQTQKVGGVVYYYDVENKLDIAYAKALGVDPDAMQMVETKQKTIEAGIIALDRIVQGWIDAKAQDIPLHIAWDSIGQSPVLEEIAAVEEGTGKRNVSSAARQLRGMFRVLMDKAAKARVLLTFINHTYAQIGGMPSFSGPKQVGYGGGGMRFAATMRIMMIRTEMFKGTGGVKQGIIGLSRFDKNHLSACRDARYAIEYGKGFNIPWEIIEILKTSGHVVGDGKKMVFGFTSADGKVVSHEWGGGSTGLQKKMLAEPDFANLITAFTKAIPVSALPTSEED